MLEVLDPEQNTSFYDNFIESGFDLSKVMFIATSNNIANVQPALRDRMEIVQVSGYTIEEKYQIAKKHLIPKQIKEHGLKRNITKINKFSLIKIIEGYTRESGVRGLEKQIAKIIRNIAKSLAMEENFSLNISSEDVNKILGVSISKDKYENNDIAGVVTGLAWTQFGGDILFIESALSRGKGNLTITGNLGKVMKESATIALEYIKSNANRLSIDTNIFSKYNIHIHVPEGATPKDGPSAGITMLTSLVSLFTQKRVKSKLAMTGEITLRGKVLPVGGIKEKILAAKRAKITEIILCQENRKNIEEIDSIYLKGLTFHYVSNMHQVLDIAITNKNVKNSKNLNVK
jgi:ATP-dependent Lon protease